MDNTSENPALFDSDSILTVLVVRLAVESYRMPCLFRVLSIFFVHTPRHFFTILIVVQNVNLLPAFRFQLPATRHPLPDTRFSPLKPVSAFDLGIRRKRLIKKFLSLFSHDAQYFRFQQSAFSKSAARVYPKPGFCFLL